MSYAEFCDGYTEWLKSQLDYANGSSDYVDFSAVVEEISADFEVRSFKQAVTTDAQIIFHNAADDQVAAQRALAEISKTPSSYMADYISDIDFEIQYLAIASSKTDKSHETQNSDKETYNYCLKVDQAGLDRVSVYEPSRVLS